MLRLSLAAALFSLSACDSGGTEADQTCASIGVPEAGTVTATTPNGAFQTSCANVVYDEGLLVAIARETGSGTLGGATIEIYVDGTEPGTYAFDSDDISGASYGPSPDAMAEARSGSITVSSFEGGVVGTFEFVTTTGREITGGRFEFDL